MSVETDSVSKTKCSVQNNRPTTMSRHPVILDVTQQSYSTPELKISDVFFHNFWPIHFMNTKIPSVASITTAHGPHCLLHHMLVFSNVKFFGNTLNKISGNVFYRLVLLLYSDNQQSVHFSVVCKSDSSTRILCSPRIAQTN